MIGIYDDPIVEMVEPKDAKLVDLNMEIVERNKGDEYSDKIAQNIKFVRDIVKEFRPDSLVVEMCDDRYGRWLSDVVAHPNYETTISSVHKIIDKNTKRLKEYDQIDINDSNMEYLIGIDFCTYRLPCTTIMGDRSYKTTRKRYESKVQMLDVYKEAVTLGTGSSKPAKSGASQKTIFDLKEED